MADYNQAKNERLRGRKYKYKENYITEVNTVHGVSEYEPKQETFELFEKENKFNESKQTDDTVQNENANLIETNRRGRTLILQTLWKIAITIQKLKRRDIHGRDILKNVHWT